MLAMSFKGNRLLLCVKRKIDLQRKSNDVLEVYKCQVIIVVAE